MIVRLTDDELAFARRLAEARNRDSKRRGSSGNYGASADDVSLHLTGARGEVAAARGLHLPLVGGVGRFEQRDVGHYHVRTRRFGTGTDLMVRATDPSQWILLHARELDAEGRSIELVGEGRVSELKQSHRMRNAGGRKALVQFVRDEELHPLGHYQAEEVA